MSFPFSRLLTKTLLCLSLSVFAQVSYAATLDSEVLLPQPSEETAYLLPVAEALDAGNLTRAESLLRARIEVVPEDPIAWEALGVTLALGGDVSGADFAYGRAVEIEPAQLSAWVKRGDLAQAAGNMADALAYWTSVIEIAPNYAPAHQRLGIAYADANDLPRAIQHLEAILSDENSNAKVELAFVYNRAGRPDDTLALFAGMDVATQTDEAVDARLMLAVGNAYAQVGNVNEALSHYQRGLDVAPDDNGLLKANGALLIETGDAANAVVSLSRPAAVEPVDAFSNLQYARALLVLGNTEEAIAAAQRALGANASPDITRQALSVLARGNLMMRDFPAATDATTQLVTLLPDDPASWREHGAIHGAAGQYEDAKDIYNEAILRFDDDAELLRGRSIVNVRLGQLEAAAQDAELAADLAPNWLEPQFLLGEIELARGLDEEAERAFRAAVALNPDHWPSLVNIAALRLAAGDTVEALALSQRAVEISNGAQEAVEILEKVTIK